MANSKKQSFGLLSLFVVLLSALLISQVLVVGAQTTPQTGALGDSGFVNSPDGLVDNEGDPIVVVGDDGEVESVALGGFGAQATGKRQGLSLGITGVPDDVAARWAAGGFLASDVTILCFTSTPGILTGSTARNPQATFANGIVTVSANIDQGGHCAVFVNVGGGSAFRDVSAAGISG